MAPKRRVQLAQPGPIHEEKIEIDGQQINYARAGDGPEVILMLPGEIGCWATDYKFHLEFPPAGFTLVAIDLPGYGKSIPPEREYHKNLMKDDADIAHALMAELKLLPYNVFGWGESGRAALCMATNENKQHVKRMVLWGVQVNLTLQGFRIYENCKNMRDFCTRQFLKRCDFYGEQWAQDAWAKYCAYNKRVYQDERGALCQELLKECQVAVLLIHGERDRLPKYYIETLQQQLPNCKGIRIHEEGYHDVHNEFRDWFWEQVKPFLLEKTEN